MFDSIGSSADEIAKTLRDLGIKGTPNTVASLNPVVRYVLTRIETEAMMIDVIRKTQLTLTFRDWSTQIIPLPKAV